ncbi:hypothetical protein ScPMuIL_001959 [Solemya velum]
MQENKVVGFNPLDLLATAAALQTVSKNSHHSMTHHQKQIDTENNDENENVNKTQNPEGTRECNERNRSSCVLDSEKVFDEHNYDNAKQLNNQIALSDSSPNIEIASVTESADQQECMNKQEIVNKAVISSDEHVTDGVIDTSSEFIDNTDKTAVVYSGELDQDVAVMKPGIGDLVGSESEFGPCASISECNNIVKKAEFFVSKIEEIEIDDKSQAHNETINKEVDIGENTAGETSDVHGDKIQVHISSPSVQIQSPVEQTQTPSLIINIDIDREQIKEPQQDRAVSTSSSKHTIIRSLLTGEQHSSAKIKHTDTPNPSIEDLTGLNSTLANMPNQISQKSGILINSELNSSITCDENSLIGFCVPESDVTGTGLGQDTDKLTSEDDVDSLETSGEKPQIDMVNADFSKKVNRENWNSALKNTDGDSLQNDSQCCHENNQFSTLSVSDSKDITLTAHSSCLGLKCLSTTCDHDDKFHESARQDECKASQVTAEKSCSNQSVITTPNFLFENEVECESPGSRHGSFVADHCYAESLGEDIPCPIRENECKQKQNNLHHFSPTAGNSAESNEKDKSNAYVEANLGENICTIKKTSVLSSESSMQVIQSETLQKTEKESISKRAIVTIGEWLNDKLSPSNLKPSSPSAPGNLSLITKHPGESLIENVSKKTSNISVDSDISSEISGIPNSEVEQAQNSLKFGKFKIGSFASFSNTKSDVKLENPDQKSPRNMVPAVVSIPRHIGHSPWKLHGTAKKMDCVSDIHHDHDYCFRNGVLMSQPNIYNSELSKELLSPLKGFSRTKERKIEIELPKGEKPQGRKYVRRMTSVTASRVPTLKRVDTDDSSVDSFSDASSPSSPSTPIMRTRGKLERNFESTKPDQSKMKITGHFQDEFVYFLNTKVRSRRRSALNVQPAVPSDKIILPIPKPGDIVVPHLTDADIEALKQKASMSLAQSNLKHEKKLGSSTSSGISVQTHQFSSQSDNIIDDEAKLINTILSMESGEMVSNNTEDNLTFSEPRDMMGPGGDGFSLNLSPEQMNLTPEQMEILFNAVDDLAEHPDVLNTSNTEQTPEQLQVASKSCQQSREGDVNSDTCVSVEEIDVLSKTTVISSKSELVEGSAQETGDSLGKRSTIPNSVTDEDPSPPCKSIESDDDETSQFTNDPAPKLDEPCCDKKEAVAVHSSSVDVTSQPLSSEHDMSSPASSQSGYCGPEEAKDKMLTLALVPENSQSPSTSIGQSSSGSQNSGNALTDLPFTSFDRSSLDILDNDFKLDKTDLFPEATDLNQCSSNQLPVTAQEYNMPWIVTVNMYWNDLPAVMIENFPYVRLVDIHKQILPAKDTGILKKRCQLLGIKVKNCVEMQRYFLVQYGRAYNSKSTLIVSKDDAKVLIGYYVDPQPKIVKSSSNLEIKKAANNRQWKGTRHRELRDTHKKFKNKKFKKGMTNSADSKTEDVEPTDLNLNSSSKADEERPSESEKNGIQSLMRVHSSESIAVSEISTDTETTKEETNAGIRTEINKNMSEGSCKKGDLYTDPPAVMLPASPTVCSRSTSPLVHMGMQDSDSSPSDLTTPSPQIQRNVTPETKTPCVVSGSKCSIQKKSVIPVHVSRSTRHKKINFIEMLKGEAAPSTSEHDDPTTCDKSEDQKHKVKKTISRKGVQSNSPEGELGEHDTSRKRSRSDSSEKQKNRKRSVVSNVEDVRENKIRKIAHVNNSENENSNKRVEKTSAFNIKRDKEEHTDDSNGISSYGADENILSHVLKKHKHRPLLSMHRRLRNGRKKLHKNKRIIKLKVNGISQSGGDVEKRMTFNKSNTLKIVHKDAGLRNGHRNSMQAGDVFVDSYEGKSSACIQCCTCRKLLCVEDFLRHLHDGTNGGKLLPVAQLQTLEMRDFCKHGSLQGKLWQSFIHKRELFENNKLLLESVKEPASIKGDINNSKEKGVGYVGTEVFSVKNTGKNSVTERSHRQLHVVPSLQESRRDRGSLRTSARKRKQKQLYPIENYSFTKSAQRIHLSTGTSDGDEPDEQLLDSLSSVPHCSKSVLALTNGPEVTSFTALEQDVDM